MLRKAHEMISRGRSAEPANVASMRTLALVQSFLSPASNSAEEIKQTRVTVVGRNRAATIDCGSSERRDCGRSEGREALMYALRGFAQSGCCTLTQNRTGSDSDSRGVNSENAYQRDHAGKE